MVTENFANGAFNYLSADIDHDDTTITLHDARRFPEQGKFRVRIGGEIIIATYHSTTQLNVVTRGADDSTASFHSAGDLCIHIVTAHGYKQYLKDRWLFAGDPPPCGHIRDTDGSILTVGDFTWVNQGTAVATDVNNCIGMVSPKASGTQWRHLNYTAPSTPYTITVGVQLCLTNSETGSDGYPGFGVGFRDSITGRLHVFTYLFRGGSININVSRFNSNTVFNSAETPGISLVNSGGLHWVRCVDNGTNFIFKYSVDGKNWNTFVTVGRTAFLTTPDRVLFGLDAGGTNDTGNPGQAATIFHYSLNDSAL